jgi:hypothetical protein
MTMVGITTAIIAAIIKISLIDKQEEQSAVAARPGDRAFAFVATGPADERFANLQ